MSLAKWKERERQERQNDIIKAARKLFADKGFEVFTSVFEFVLIIYIIV